MFVESVYSILYFVSRYKAELAKKEAMLAAVQKDLSSLSAKYEQQKHVEDDMMSKCAAAECKLIACFKYV